MKVLKRWVCLFLFAVVFFSPYACTKQSKPDHSFQAGQAANYVYYAHPEGGIRAYLAASNEVIKITDEYDFHPNYLPDGYVYFLRYQKQKDSSKNPPPLKVMAWNAMQNKSKEIATLSSISPLPNLKNQCFFVDNGEKLLILNHNQDPVLINISLDQSISSFNMIPYSQQINLHSKKMGTFLLLVQYPHQNVFKNKNDLLNPIARSAIISIGQDYTLNIWDEIPGEDLFQDSFHGLCFDDNNDQLVFSRNTQLYAMHNHENRKKLIGEGVHPFILRKNTSLAPILDFSWLQVNFLMIEEPLNIFTTSSHMSFIHQTEHRFHIINSSDMGILSKNPEDEHHLFDRLIFIGQHKLMPSKYLLISMARTNHEDTPANIRRDQMDQALIFSLEDGQYKRYWSNSGQFYGEVWIQDLNHDGKAEILNQYCASSFRCPDDIRLNGRSLVWINIYHQNESFAYERANEDFPDVYRELWERLHMVNQEMEKQKRLGNTYLCEADLMLLDQLMEESYRLSTPGPNTKE